MTRKAKSILALSLIIAAFIASDIWAFTPGVTLDSVSDPSKYKGLITYVDGTYNVSYPNGNPSTEYLLYVIDYDSGYLDYKVLGENIEYITQVKSDTNGKINISFNQIIPNNSIVILAGNKEKIIIGEILEQINLADVNQDHIVDKMDLVYAKSFYGAANDRCDVNDDGIVDFLDITFIVRSIKN